MISDSTVTDFSEFIQVACDNCGSNQSKILFTGPDRLCGLPGTFTLVQCCECGWIRQNPRPSDRDIWKYYPKDYVAFVSAVDDEKRLWNRLDRQYGLIKRRKSIERFVSHGRILEIGCGTGVFLAEMRRCGWSTIGLEPNAYASEYARTKLGLDVFCTTLEQFELPYESFDVVYLSNVLEHLARPAQAIRRIRHTLKKGGLLVMSIPNLESLDRKLFGESWIGWELPRHLYLFPRQSLENLFKQLDMQIITRDCPAGSHYAFLLSLQLYLQDRTNLSRCTIRKSIEVLRQLPIRLCASPVFWLLDKLQLSAILTYYVRKN